MAQSDENIIKGNKNSKSKAGDEYIKSLQAEIARNEADKDAIRSEFEKIVEEDLNPEQIREKIRKELLPAAWITLQELILNADSDAARINLAKWVVERAAMPLGDETADPDKEFKVLLKQLAGKE